MANSTSLSFARSTSSGRGDGSIEIARCLMRSRQTRKKRIGDALLGGAGTSEALLIETAFSRDSRPI